MSALFHYYSFTSTNSMSTVSLSPSQLQKLIELEKGHEPFLIPTKGRFGSIPIRNTKAWEYYKNAEKVIWTADEIPWEKDIHDWQTKLTDDEREFVSKTLSFFYGIDGMITENLAMNFYQEVQCPSVRSFWAIQISVETIHTETYGKGLFNLIKDEATREDLIMGIVEDPYIKMKADWIETYCNKNSTFAERILAFAIVEGVFFQASFCAIFWLKKRGLLPGLCLSNELISRDENLHFEFAAWVYNQLVLRLPTEDVHKIIKRTVEIECKFVTSILPVSLIGINSSSMCDYVKFMADRLCSAIHAPKIYNVSNPFPWMELISLDGKTNFFERRPAEYQRFAEKDQQMYYAKEDVDHASTMADIKEYVAKAVKAIREHTDYKHIPPPKRTIHTMLSLPPKRGTGDALLNDMSGSVVAPNISQKVAGIDWTKTVSF